MLIIEIPMFFKKLYFKIFKSKKEYSDLKSEFTLSQQLETFDKKYKKIIEQISNAISKKKGAQFFTFWTLW